MFIYHRIIISFTETKFTENDINKLIEESEERKQKEETADQMENDKPSDYPNTQFEGVGNVNNFIIYSCAEGEILVYLSLKFLLDN
jgi:hypothetical protein